MLQTYRVDRNPDGQTELVLPGSASLSLPPGFGGRVVLSHGARRSEAQVRFSAGDADRICAGSQVIDALGLLPDLIPYQIRWRGGELCIGPVIGILAGISSDRLDLSAGGYARQFLLRYPQVGGLVYLFGAREIDFEREEIDGWCWVPREEGTDGPALSADWERARQLADLVRRRAEEDAEPAAHNPRTARFEAMAKEFLAQTSTPGTGCEGSEPPPGGRWSGAPGLGSGRFERGRFPFPGAIWRRSDLLGQWAVGQLAARIGPRIFNSSFFDKEEGYRLLSADPVIRSHLPATEPFTSFPRLLARVGADGAAILKRQEGNSGYGLIRVDQDGEGYQLRFREQSGAAERIGDAEALEARLASDLAGARYLVQQCIHLPEYRGRLSDYRVMMQKDGAGRWVDRAMLGRFGARDSIVTNFVNNGYALPAAEALRRAFGVDYREAHSLCAEITDFATAVCHALDRTGGCYGDLGLDIALDRDRRLWLFEANKLPFLELPLLMGDEQMYLEVKSGGLLYAAHLAGFGEE